MKKNLVFLFIMLSVSLQSAAQDNEDYFKENYLRYENLVYDPNIRSIQFERYGVQFSDPVMTLGSSEQLFLAFDDISAEYKSLMFTLIHCDASWNPSNLMQNEYLDGFFEERIDNYQYSFNTLQKYIHYVQVIPGREARPKLSGNYLLLVYPEGYPDKPVLTRRMMVLQQEVTVEAEVDRATVVSLRETHHEIDFSINYPAVKVANPFEDIKVVLRQNNRWDNAIFGLKPLFLKENLLEYDYEDGNVFPAGNEFRNFDITTLRMQTLFVKNIVTSDNGFTAVLMEDRSKSADRYVVEPDINGNRLIRNQHVSNSDLESEYVSVKFRLKHELLANGNFYVFGSLSDWQCKRENMMTYNPDENAYEALLYVKQGYYNYQYVFVQDGKKTCDETLVEGSHYETENQYCIMVYYRPMGGRYDRLVSYTPLKSKF